MIQTIVVILTLLALDTVWLGILATNLYKDEIGNLMRMSNGTILPLWPAAAVVYFALVLGILLFTIPKANGNLLSALLWGGVFGFIVYATYDFTCLAILSRWSLKISIIDTIWGIVLCSLTTFSAVLIKQITTAKIT